MHPESATRRIQDGFAWHLRASTGSISAARTAFETWLGQAPAGAEDRADLAVVLSELASNAVNGADPADARADIRAGVDGRDLWLEVSNPVPADAGHVLRWDLDDPLRGGGRGLMIVRAYTDSMAVESGSDGVTVRCTRRLDPAG